MPFRLPRNFDATAARESLTDCRRLTAAFVWETSSGGRDRWVRASHEGLSQDDELYILRCLAAYHGMRRDTRMHITDLRNIIRRARGNPEEPFELWPTCCQNFCQYMGLPTFGDPAFNADETIFQFRLQLALADWERQYPNGNDFTTPKLSHNALTRLKYRLLCRRFEHLEKIPQPESSIHLTSSLAQILAARREYERWRRKPHNQIRINLPNALAYILDTIEVELPTAKDGNPKLFYWSEVPYFTDAHGNRMNAPDLPDGQNVRVRWELRSFTDPIIVQTNFRASREGHLHPHNYGGRFHTCGSDANIVSAIDRGDIFDYLAILDHMASRVNDADRWRTWHEVACECGHFVESDADVYTSDSGVTFCRPCWKRRTVNCPCCGVAVRASAVQNDRLELSHRLPS